jgi:hypothetical protein
MNKNRQRSVSDSSDKANKSPVEIVVAKYGLLGTTITALLGLFGLAITGYFTYLATRTQVIGPINITQTAEANLVSPIIKSTPTTSFEEASPTSTQEPLPEQAATEAPVSEAHAVACFYHQNESQTPIEVLAETVTYSGNSQLALANGQRIPFRDISRFELIEISAGNHAFATITLANDSSFTEELKYGDSSFSGSTDRGELSLAIDQVKQIVFGPKGSCQPGQTALSTPTATKAPVAEAHDVACFYYQNESQAPIEALAETLRYSGSNKLSLANGERIPFKNIGRFELIQISAGNHALVTITLLDGTALTEELTYGDSAFSGSTEVGTFIIRLEDVKRIVFGLKGSCQ